MTHNQTRLSKIYTAFQFRQHKALWLLMNIVKQTFLLLLYGSALGIISVSLNYIYDKFGVPKDILISIFVAIILLSAVITKWKKLPKENLIVLGVFISCSIGYSSILAVDFYVIDFFEPNIFWMATAYLPLGLIAMIVFKKDEGNP